ncbi:MAG: LacI family DNA-binding transcriptional regulator [Armatimonadota bacterium]
MVSVRKLAALAGVSIATVSRALRDDPSVRPETKQRILDIAKQFHYNPNRLTQGLFTGKSRTIGFIVPHLNTTGYVNMLRGVLSEAYANAHHVIVSEGHTGSKELRDIFRQLVAQRVDGILCRPMTQEPIPREALLESKSNGIITIGIDLYSIDSPIDHVRCDEEQLAETIVEYLVNLGHRRIAFVGEMSRHQVYGRGVVIQQALRKRGLPTDMFCEGQNHRLDTERAREVLQQLLTMKQPPTAIIGWDDPVACRLLQQAQQFHIQVPQEVSIIGAGNMAIAEYAVPTLTSVEQFGEELGRAAVRMLIKRIQGEEERDAHQVETVNIPCQIVERDSCAPPPRHGRKGL